MRKSVFHRLRQSANVTVEEEVEGPDPNLKCPISLSFDSRVNTYLIIYGYLQGLYSTEDYPATGCLRCKETALAFSQLLYALSNILDLQADLATTDLASMSVFEQLDFLYQSFLAFWDFGVHFDMLMRSDTAIIQYRQFLNLVDATFANVVRTNVQKNLSTLLTLVSNFDMANSECRHTGVILGALLRKTFNFQLVN